jgi:hypothetical protein
MNHQIDKEMISIGIVSIDGMFLFCGETHSSSKGITFSDCP